MREAHRCLANARCRAPGTRTLDDGCRALRNTRDFRLLAKPQDATLLERIELFRALTDAHGSEQAIQRMEKTLQSKPTRGICSLMGKTSFRINAA